MKVLIVKTSSMGDVIHTFPAVEDARRAVPGIAFDWCVEEAFAPIVALHPAIVTIHRAAVRRWRKTLFRAGTFGEIARLSRALKSARYDLVIDAQGLLKSAFLAKLAGAPVVGFDGRTAREPLAAMFYRDRHHVPRGLHAIERTRRLFGQALGYEPDLPRQESGIMPPAVPEDFLRLPAPAFLLHGTSREDKKWPAADWIETARLLAARGMTPVTTFSNDAERGVAEAIAAAVPAMVLVPKSPLGEIAALIAHSKLAIGADTGLTHLAAAFGLPTVALFIATQPGLTGPRGAYASTLLATQGKPVMPEQVVVEAQRLVAEQNRSGNSQPR